ncbi:LysR family transcriptional regulator [bacterium]|nr:LysR family transcriptional regulator [bacterium]
MDDTDWTLYRSFLAVAETGSLSAAARRLNLSQPTLGRHVAELEAALGTPLFTRIARGLAPTEAALALIPSATVMRDAAARLALTAAGRQERLSGTVRLTASQVVSHHILPPMLARLRQAEPGIQIELVPSDTTENLLFREADIALRMYRPTQSDVVIRHLIDLPMALYAAKDYLDRHGRPGSIADLARFDIVGMDRSELILRMVQRLGFGRQREDFPLRCDDQLVYWALVRAGCGLGGALTLIGEGDPLVERVAGFLALPPLPVWLTAPEALRQNPRIRRVLDHLAAEFRTLSPPP